MVFFLSNAVIFHPVSILSAPDIGDDGVLVVGGAILTN